MQHRYSQLCLEESKIRNTKFTQSSSFTSEIEVPFLFINYCSLDIDRVMHFYKKSSKYLSNRLTQWLIRSRVLFYVKKSLSYLRYKKRVEYSETGEWSGTPMLEGDFSRSLNHQVRHLYTQSMQLQTGSTTGEPGDWKNQKNPLQTLLFHLQPNLSNHLIMCIWQHIYV